MKARLTGAAVCGIAALLLLTADIAAQNSRSVVISASNLVFPATPVGSQSAPITVTVTNAMNIPVQLQELLVSGIDFAETNDCGKELAANAHCAIQITFKPAITGDRLGSLEVLASGSNVPQFVALSGTGE